MVAFNHNFRSSGATNSVEERSAGTMMYVIQAVVGGYLVIISILGISAARKVGDGG